VSWGAGVWSVKSGAGGGGGSQTPWTSDIDAANHSLTGLGSITGGTGDFTLTGGPGGYGVNVAGSDGTTGNSGADVVTAGGRGNLGSGATGYGGSWSATGGTSSGGGGACSAFGGDGASGKAGGSFTAQGGTGHAGAGAGASLIVRGGSAAGVAGTIGLTGDTTITGALLATNFTAWTDVAATDTWSNATTNIRWRQVGSKVEAFVLTTCTGTPASAGYSFTLPGSMPAVDTTNIGGNTSLIGHMTYYDASAGFYTGLVYYNGTDCYCYVNSGSGITTLLTEASPATVANGDKVMSIISYPCT